MTSYSRTYYEAYHVASGEAVGSEGDYDHALAEAAMAEMSHRQNMADEFASVEDYLAAVARATCAVRFVRAERLTAR